MKVFIYTLKLQDCPWTGTSPASLLLSLLEGDWSNMGQVLSDALYTGLLGSKTEIWGSHEGGAWEPANTAKVPFPDNELLLSVPRH